MIENLDYKSFENKNDDQLPRQGFYPQRYTMLYLCIQGIIRYGTVVIRYSTGVVRYNNVAKG